MNKKAEDIGKGYRMEETLRNYFLKMGHYVQRGVPFIVDEYHITDIDLWVYWRESSLTKGITIVDIKNKKTPQAIERILWTHGLRKATKATKAIVATTDKRTEVSKFGKELDILVLDGNFLNRINKPDYIDSGRLTEEDLKNRILSYRLSKIDGDWNGRIFFCKSLLSHGLSFDNCNVWLEQAHYFAEQVLVKPRLKEIALRCFYLTCSYIALTVDYFLKDLSFVEQNERMNIITEGFSYGSRGKASTQNVLDLSLRLVEPYLQSKSLISKIRSDLNKQISDLNTVILGEYFAKNDVSVSLFKVAKELESLAMMKLFSAHTESSVELRSLLYCLLDFWSIDRKKFSDASRLEEQSGQQLITSILKA